MVRRAEAGVTLIEMLAALSVSALIGIAGFTLLDGVTTRDAQLAGRLERLAQQDRAFRLLMQDTDRALRAEMLSGETLRLTSTHRVTTWRADDMGLLRVVGGLDGGTVSQVALRSPSRLARHPDFPDALVLTLPEDGTPRIFRIPPIVAP